MLPQRIAGTTFIAFLAAFSLLSTPNLPVLFTTLRALAQAPEVRIDEVNSMLRLTAAGEPQIELLRGIQWGKEQTQRTFQGAGWTFYPDGRFVLTPTQTANSRTKLFPISGTYSKDGNTYEIQGEHRVSSSSVSVDGTIRIHGDNIVLDVIYTISAPRQIARISQSLAKQPQTAVNEPGIENNPVFSLAQPSNETRTTEAAGGSKIETTQNLGVFEVSLEGKTEAGSFGPVPGLLYITPGSGRERPCSVRLFMANPELLVRNGGIIWKSERQDPNSKIQENSSQVRIEVRPSERMREIRWYTLPSDKSPSSSPVPVFIENGIFTFSIQGNRISGEIRASGLYSTNSSFNQPSNYEAKLTGEIQKSSVAEKLLAELNASSFNGRWDTGESAFGQISLQQNAQQVSGTYTGRGGGKIEGIVQGNRLDFTWKDNQQGQGWGFFRAIAGGGTLTGLWGNTADRTNSQSLVAAWQLPNWLATQTFDPLDIQKLREIGHELVGQSRCEQAVALLDQALAFYRTERQKKETQSQVQTNYLLNEGFSLVAFLSSCNFQLGNYDKLLENLEYSLEIERLLGPEESSSRRFRERTADLAQALTSYSELLEIWQNGFTDLKQEASGSSFIGRVGTFLVQDEKTKALIISKVFKAEPAHVAGILPQDVLIKINGRSTQGMDVEQAIKNIRGTPGTQVTLTMRRGNQELDFKLTRIRKKVYPVHRQAELIQALEFLSDYLKNLRARLATNLNQLSTLEKRIAEGQADPVEALISLTEDLKGQKAQLDTETNKVIALGKEVFKEQKALLQDTDSGFKAASSRSCKEPRDINLKEVTALDERITRFLESNHELSLVESTLFQGYLHTSLTLNSLSLKLDCQRVLLEHRDPKKDFEENRQRTQEQASSLANRLEKWRTRLVEDLDKIDALDKAQSFFQKLVKLLIELGNENEALVASEKSRARAFADLLATRLTSKAASQSSADSPTLQQLQQIAKAQNATFVEYSIISDAFKVQGKEQTRESELYIWVVKPTGEVKFHPVDLKPLWQQQNTSLEDLVRSILKSSRGEWGQPLKKLHQLLIQPIADLLPKDPNARVVFIPQKSLFLVPFPALQDAAGKYLIEQHTILTAPSIQVLALTHTLSASLNEQQGRRRVLGEDALVVGNPIMPSVAPQIGGQRQQLDPLRHAEEEATEIADLLNTKAIIGNQATKVNILQQMPRSRIIHLATHGRADDTRGVESWIALAPSGKDNGLLTAEEIFDLKLHAELVVLSACETGRGRLTGDGVIGLSRSLISAGVPSVIVSLWTVPDDATKLLMTEFYRNLQHKPDKAQALRQAMLTTMKQRSAPLNWAAFTLIGEAE